MVPGALASALQAGWDRLNGGWDVCTGGLMGVHGSGVVESIVPPGAAGGAMGFPVSQVLEAYARGQLERAIDCLSWPGRRRHSGVHQARKSLRRVRATLALAGDALGVDLTAVDAEIRRINVSLSELRDAQALVEVLDRLRKHADGPESRALLGSARRAAIARRVQVLRTHLRTDPELCGRRDQLAALGQRLGALDWPSLTASQVECALVRSTRRAARAGRRAVSGGSDERWHRWRRRVRRLGQQVHALGTAKLSTDPHSKKLAGLLGDAQDLTLLAAHCGDDSPFAPDDLRALAKFARKQGKRARAKILGHAGRHGGRMLAMGVWVGSADTGSPPHAH